MTREPSGQSVAHDGRRRADAGNPLSRLTDHISRVVELWLPSPLVLALILTVAAVAAAMIFTPRPPLALLRDWSGGLWGLLAFTMQMVLVLVTGHALANAPPVLRGLRRLARAIPSAAFAAPAVTLVAGVGCLINWGFGLILGAFFAREVAREVRGCHYPLLIAAGYIGFMTWHGGLSGSVPLLAATAGNPLEAKIGLIPLSQSLLRPFNVFISAALLVALPLIVAAMRPPPGKVIEFDGAAGEKAPGVAQWVLAGPAARLEESRGFAWATAAAIAAGLIATAGGGHRMDINTTNAAMLAIGLALHGSLRSYAAAASTAAGHAGNIVLLYPFYAALQALIDTSGLGALVTQGVTAHAGARTFPIAVFFASGLINFAIPSGGGHWAVQGPLVMPVAATIGADFGKSAMAIAYGEAWMNMAQPFWAVPALAIAGLQARHVMGYCLVTLVLTVPIFLVGLYWL